MLSLRGLLCVISGLLAGGSPGFRTVLCCFFLTNLVWRVCFVVVRFSLVAWLLSPYQSQLMQSHFLLQCVIYGPLSDAMFPLFWFLFAVPCLFCFLFVLLCFLFGPLFCFIAWRRPIGLCTGPSSALLLRPINKWGN